MSASGHFDAMERVRELLCGRDPLSQNYLAAVGAEQWFTQGSVTPPLGPRYAQTPAGLIVPMSVAREPAPIDQVKLYLTSEESLGAAVPLEQVLAALVRLPVELALPWVARWLSALRRPAASQAAVDAAFVDEHLLEPHRTRVRNILRDPGRVLVTPQALFCLAKLALLLCPSSGGSPPDEDVRPLVFALLGLADHLSADLDGLDEAEEIVIGDRPGPLGREIIANQLANSNRQETGRWTAFQRCWRELPRELAGHPRVVDLEAAYESATGVPLDDLVTICGAAWASCANGNVMLAPNHFDGLGWSPERLKRVLQLISCDPASLSVDVRLEAEEFGIAWAIGTFERYPLVRWPSGHLTVVDPELILDRGCGVWPLYDILRELEARGESAQARRVRGAYDHVCETYAREVVASIVGDPSGSRLFDEDQLRTAFGRKRKTADLAIDYGHSWVVLDATTTGLQRLTFAGTSDDAVVQDFEKIVEKARQLDATISALRANEGRLTGVPRVGYRRFYPVVVTSTKFAAGPIFVSMLHDRLRGEGLLQSRDTAPLEVMEFEDLDVVEGLVESGGPGFTELLGGKAESGLRNMSVRDYVMLTLGRRDVRRPRRVDVSWRSWVDTALNAFRGAD